MNNSSLDLEIQKSLQIVKRGGIILYPTDTIWGIGCDATNASAIKKIYELKKRAQKKSMIILVTDTQMISNYVSKPSEKILSYIISAPQPTTAIFKHAMNLPTQLINEDGTVAIRIIKDDFCQQLIQQLKKPIVSTSANISGDMYPADFSSISETIKNGVDYIVQHRQNELSSNMPSVIIRLNEQDEIERLR